MLLGIWKNVAELEESITLEELELILDAHREQVHANQKFFAALKGIDLDAPSQDEVNDRMERVRNRAAARLKGANPEHADLESMGIDIEIEE
jgi:hypothetical protein